MRSRRPASRAAASVILVSLLTAPLLAQSGLEDVTLRSGERIEVSLETALSSRSSHVGDNVDATLANDEVREGTVVLPAGSKLQGRVEAVQRADRRSKMRARLRIVFDQIVLPSGQVLPAKAFLEQIGPEPPSNRKRSAKGEIIGLLTLAAVGALIGLPVNGLKGAGVGAAIGGGLGVLFGLLTLRIHGDDVYLYGSQKVLIQLDQNLTVHVPPSPKP